MAPSFLDSHPLGPRVGRGGGISSTPPPLGPGFSAVPQGRRVWRRRRVGREEGRGLAAGPAAWTEFMGCGEAAGPDPEPEPCIPLLPWDSFWPRCSRPHTPLPRLSQGLFREGHPDAALTLQRSPPLCCARSQAHSPAQPPLPPFAGQRRTAPQWSSAGGDVWGVAPGVRPPESRLRSSEPSLWGSGVQTVPGGGALEPGLEFSPNLHAAGWDRGGRLWEPPPQA